jgi:HlyD family secretion protein
MQSPDRLDALPAVGHPQRWLFRVALMLLASIAVGWAAFGIVETRVVGRCIIISPSGVAEVTSSAEGRISDLRVNVGAQVAANALIATIQRPAFDEQLRKVRNRLSELRARQESVRALILRSLAQGEQISRDEAGMLEQRLKTLGARRELLAKRLDAQQRLQQEGLVTRQNLLATEQQLTENLLEADQVRSRMKQTAFFLEEDRRALQNEQAALALQAGETERELETLLAQQSDLLQVRSPYAGRVIEVKADNGKLVSFGDALVVIERSVEADAGAGVLPLAALIFVPGGDGKLVQPGMSAEVTPTTVKRQEYGFVRARVERVSDFPASGEAVRQLIQNPNVVKELAGDGAPVQISAMLLTDPAQGYVWSAAAGTPPQLRSGTLCDADVIVRSQRPYQLFWPLLKKITGLV